MHDESIKWTVLICDYLKIWKEFSIVSNIWMHFISLKYMDALHCFYFYLVNYINIIIIFFNKKHMWGVYWQWQWQMFVVVVVVKYVTFANSVRKRFNKSICSRCYIKNVILTHQKPILLFYHIILQYLIHQMFYSLILYIIIIFTSH